MYAVLIALFMMLASNISAAESEKKTPVEVHNERCMQADELQKAAVNTCVDNYEHCMPGNKSVCDPTTGWEGSVCQKSSSLRWDAQDTCQQSLN